MFLQLAKYNYAQFYGIDVCKVRNEHVTTGLNIGNRKSCLESWVVAVPTSQDRTASRESSNDRPIISTDGDRHGRSGPLISGMRRYQLKKQSQDNISSAIDHAQSEPTSSNAITIPDCAGENVGQEATCMLTASLLRSQVTKQEQSEVGNDTTIVGSVKDERSGTDETARVLYDQDGQQPSPLSKPSAENATSRVRGNYWTTEAGQN